jgi:hypothetical protein
MSDDMLPDGLTRAVNEFKDWSQQHLQEYQKVAKITTSLYHYTNGAGLRGIIESQKIWLTSYRHLNDPSELIHGFHMVHRLLRKIGDGARDGLVKTFCQMVIDEFQHKEIFNDIFGFYIASFSRNSNDLAQWRSYADNGRGFALGLAPHLIQKVSTPNAKPPGYIVVPVLYDELAAQQWYRSAVETAIGLIQNNPPPPNFEIPFLRRLTLDLIVRHLILACVAVKHQAYSHEQEVRLVVAAGRDDQKGYVKTRIRGSEIVPYIEGDMPLREKDGIIEIVIGPAANTTAKDAVQILLQSSGVEPNDRIKYSGIPYRALD